MTVLIVCAAAVLGYLAGQRELIAHVCDTLEDFADARTGRIARWTVQPIYAILIAWGFVTNPVRFIRNVRHHRRRAAAMAPAYDPAWAARNGEQR